MKFARDCRSSESNEATAQLLFEALAAQVQTLARYEGIAPD